MASQATFYGVPLRLISLVILVVQNSALTILLHYSRTAVSADEMYSAASAVLLNEILKGAISLSIAFSNAVHAQSSYAALSPDDGRTLESEKRTNNPEPWQQVWESGRVIRGAEKLRTDVFSSDCWKLSIPACLYVIQNNLQFVAASNLDVPTFQVSYNLKILTTALFSVLLLKRKLTPKKWASLLCLAVGVAIIQLQSTAASGGAGKGSGGHDMNRAKGLLAVLSACMTSGLAGVYFEMVLKGSKTDLWIRNVQLSFFSFLPALLPVFLPNFNPFSVNSNPIPPPPSQAVFAHFGFWAWAVVLTQVVGGLVTALVIKYSDNIMKGFATSLAIIFSFIAGIILFHFQVTLSFVVGTVVVVGATYLYNSPDGRVLPGFNSNSRSLRSSPPHKFRSQSQHSPRIAGFPLPTDSPPLYRSRHAMSGGDTPDVNVRDYRPDFSMASFSPKMEGSPEVRIGMGGSHGVRSSH